MSLIQEIKGTLTDISGVEEVIIDASDRVWVYIIIEDNFKSNEVIDEIEAVTNKVFIDSVHEIESGILSSSREVIKVYTS